MVRNIFSNIYQKFDILLVRLFSVTPFLSSIYYTFFSRVFSREHQKLLKARIVYQRKTLEQGKSSYLLRRNIHRLEKGLIMQPRKPVFAEKYIAETVDCFALNNNELICENELKWAKDVLTEYFNIVEVSPLIKRAKIKFTEVISAKQDMALNSEFAAEKWIPYQAEKPVDAALNFEDLKNLCIQRHSVRYFKQQAIELSLLEKAIDVACQAPSACNRQPFEFKIFNNNKQASRVASLAMGTKGIHENFQCVIVVLGDLSAYPKERDRHLIYIDASLAAMQFILAVETLGLSSCPINWPDIEQREKAMDKLLDLPAYLRPVMMIAVGYADPDAMVAFSQKKCQQQISSTP